MNKFTDSSLLSFATNIDSHMINELFKGRIIYLGEDITFESSSQIIAEMLYLDSIEQTPITIYINSLGGSIRGAFAIIDSMQLVRSPVYTVGLGEVASSASLILVAGSQGHRSMLTNAVLLLHQPLGHAPGQQSDIEIKAKEIKFNRQEICMLLASRSNYSLSTLNKLIERDFFITPSKALANGLIDSVLQGQRY